MKNKELGQLEEEFDRVNTEGRHSLPCGLADSSCLRS